MTGPESEHSMGEVDRPTSTLEEALRNCIIATENAGLKSGVAVLKYMRDHVKLMADRSEIVVLPTDKRVILENESVEIRFAKKYDITPRELQILQHISKGESNRQIAAELSISFGTVKTHRARIFAKLGVHKGTAATAALLEFK